MFERATILTDRQTDRQTDVINLSFCHIFLYIVPFNIRPPEAGISRKAVMPFLGFPSPAVFLRPEACPYGAGRCVFHDG